MTKRTLFRGIALVTCVLVISACSKAVEIPRDEIGDEKYGEPGKYTIRLKNDEEYLARRFSVTDSTIVIEELLSADPRDAGAVPISIPTTEVASVSRMAGGKTGLIFGTCIFAALAYVIVRSLDDEDPVYTDRVDF